MNSPGKVIVILGSIVVACVLFTGAVICGALLFATCCSGQDLWSSSTEPWTTKAGLLAGCVLPAASGLYLMIQAARE